MLLYAQPSSYRTQRLLAIAQTNEVELKVVCDKAAENTAYGKIPVLDTGKGCIFSTNAIGRFLSRLRPDIGLYGQNFFESGEVDSWIDYCTHELEVPLHAWTGPLDKLFPDVPQATARAKEDTSACLKVLNKHLSHRTFMVGEALTFADLHLASAMFGPVEKHKILQPLLKEMPNLKRWYSLIVQQIGFQHAFGESKAVKDFSVAGGQQQGGKQEQNQQQQKGGKQQQQQQGGGKKSGGGQSQAPGSPKGGAKGKASAPPPVDVEKKLKKVLKEGGKRGVEIEGAADLGGLTFFCTTVVEPDGDLDLLEKSVDAMNEESDPSEEERKGGSGKVGKVIFSAGEHLAMVAYVPQALQTKTDATTWLTKALKDLGDNITRQDETKAIVVKKGVSGKGKAFALLKCDPSKGRYAIKLKDDALNAANGYLRANGLFPDNDDDDDDEFCFGDDDFPS